MVKIRRADYCNLKLLLIFLVVYGHWIEPQITISYTAYVQYRIIYFVHMPLFAFLSGLFLKNEKDCIRQIKHLILPYILLQGIAIVVTDVSLWKPWWHLWYLLSCCMWMTAAWVWFRYGKGKRKTIILSAAIIAGVLAGYVPFLARVLSASRTVVFFPFFWLGVISKPKTQWYKHRLWGGTSLAAAAALMVLTGKYIPVEFLYGAEPYGDIKNGWYLRMLCYLISALASFFLLTWVPAKRFAFTKAGADTMPVYLIHAPIVMLFRNENTHWFICAVLSLLLVYAVFKLVQWNSPLYGVIQNKGSGKSCRTLKKYIKNTQKQSTDFFYP